MEREQRDEEVVAAEVECPGCGCGLDPEEVERRLVLCVGCGEKLDRELSRYLDFVQECRSRPAAD